MTRVRARAADRGPAAKGRVTTAELRQLDLTSGADRRRLVCAGFCTHHRDDAGEDQACAGFVEICRLLDAAAAAPEGVSTLRLTFAKILAAPDPVCYTYDLDLESRVCRECDFAAGGACDHRNPTLAPGDRLEPCGGYVLLAALIGVLNGQR
jgi:hypothetical protein